MMNERTASAVIELLYGNGPFSIKNAINEYLDMHANELAVSGIDITFKNEVNSFGVFWKQRKTKFRVLTAFGLLVSINCIHFVKLLIIDNSMFLGDFVEVMSCKNGDCWLSERSMSIIRWHSLLIGRSHISSSLSSTFI